MNNHQCVICENTFLSNYSLNTKLEPWNCPNCNKDTNEKIQRDLNYLYNMIGFKAINRILPRANRRLTLSHMCWKKDDSPATIEMF